MCNKRSQRWRLKTKTVWPSAVRLCHPQGKLNLPADQDKAHPQVFRDSSRSPLSGLLWLISHRRAVCATFDKGSNFLETLIAVTGSLSRYLFQRQPIQDHSSCQERTYETI